MKNQNNVPLARKSKKNISFFEALVLVIFVIFQLSCQPKPQPKECVEFFNTDSTQRLKEFNEYNLEKQLTIHRCGLDWHPPYDHSYEIAKRGKNIIPALLQKLNNDNDESRYEAEKTKYAITLIFRRLAEDGNLDNNEQVIQILEQTISEIKTERLREESKTALAEIKKILVR